MIIVLTIYFETNCEDWWLVKEKNKNKRRMRWNLKNF